MNWIKLSIVLSVFGLSLITGGAVVAQIGSLPSFSPPSYNPNTTTGMALNHMQRQQQSQNFQSYLDRNRRANSQADAMRQPWRNQPQTNLNVQSNRANVQSNNNSTWVGDRMRANAQIDSMQRSSSRQLPTTPPQSMTRFSGQTERRQQTTVGPIAAAQLVDRPMTKRDWAGWSVGLLGYTPGPVGLAATTAGLPGTAEAYERQIGGVVADTSHKLTYMRENAAGGIRDRTGGRTESDRASYKRRNQFPTPYNKPIPGSERFHNRPR